jgi:hypothetical protein
MAQERMQLQIVELNLEAHDLDAFVLPPSYGQTQAVSCVPTTTDFISCMKDALPVTQTRPRRNRRLYSWLKYRVSLQGLRRDRRRGLVQTAMEVAVCETCSLWDTQIYEQDWETKPVLL